MHVALTADLSKMLKKWQDLQSHTRRKEVARKREAVKTGGGPTPLELKD
jgi:hypothetical protein